MTKLRTFLISLIIPFVLLVLWEFSVRYNLLPNTLIASPSQVIVDFFELLSNGKLLLHSLVSMKRLILGFSIGTFLGLLLGVLVGVSKFGENLIAPTIQLLAPIPPIAWIPVLIILFGIGEASKIALILLAAFDWRYVSLIFWTFQTNL